MKESSNDIAYTSHDTPNQANGQPTDPFARLVYHAQLEYTQSTEEETSLPYSRRYLTLVTRVSVDQMQGRSVYSEEALAFWRELYRLLHDNVGNASFQVLDMADHFHVSVRQFSRICKRHLGHTPLEVLREVKLQEARRLLQEQEVLSVKALYYALGISSGGHFSQLFHKRFGQYPSDMLRVPIWNSQRNG